MSGKGKRPKTPRVEIHAAQIPEWQEAAAELGMPLAAWVREAADEKLERQRKKKR